MYTWGSGRRQEQELWGLCPMARSQHFYQFHALCLQHRRAMKEAGEIHQENVWPQRELEHDNRRERKDTNSLTGQRKEKSSKTSPRSGRVTGCGWSSCRVPLSLSPCLRSRFSMQGKWGHSHCGREATVAAAWLLEPWGFPFTTSRRGVSTRTLEKE